MAENGITLTEGDGFILKGPEMISVYRLLVIRQGLKAESVGMRLTSKSKAPSCRSIVKKEFGIKDRDIKTVILKYDAILRQMGILTDNK